MKDRFRYSPSWLQITTLVVVFMLTPVSSVPQTTDFKRFGTPQSSETRGVRRLESRQLFQFTANFLQMEVFGTGERLVWVFSDSSKLHVSLGRSSSPYPAGYRINLPARPILLSANRLPHMPNTALVTVLYKRGNRYATVGYRLDFQRKAVSHSQYFHRNWAFIRPVGSFLYQQKYDMTSIWAPTVSRLSTKTDDLKVSGTVPLPERPRLGSLTRALKGHWLMITPDGRLIYASGPRTLAGKPGPYGALPMKYQGAEVSWRRSAPTEMVRMPPAYSQKHRLAVGVQNISREGGFFSNDQTKTRLDLFHIGTNNLRQAAVVGPYNGLISDVEVPHGANPGQLLWLRRTNKNQFIMEMIDLDNSFGQTNVNSQ